MLHGKWDLFILLSRLLSQSNLSKIKYRISLILKCLIMKPITHYWQNFNIVSLSLAPLSYLFCFLTSLRRFFYRLGLLKSSSTQVPLIVVGNIYVGGNGKTPFVIWLIEQLKKAGYTPAVVSRGYGAAEDAGYPWPRQADLNQAAALFGDEPFLIHKLTQCPVFIDPNRNRAVEAIKQKTHCDIIVSDDGLQHYAMSRFIEINITDAKRLYGNGLCLPAGPLRERESRLKSVDYIIYNRSRGQLSPSFKTKKTTQMLENKSFFMDYDFSALKHLSNPASQAMTLSDLKGKIVHAVAGIGNPAQFFKVLKDHGLKVIEHPFADHYNYKKEDLTFDEPYPIVMTEKDAVKCYCLLVEGSILVEDSSLAESSLLAKGSFLSDAWYLPIKAKVDQQLMITILEQLKTYKSTS